MIFQFQTITLKLFNLDKLCKRLFLLYELIATKKGSLQNLSNFKIQGTMRYWNFCKFITVSHSIPGPNGIWWNRTHANSRRMGKYRIFVNILGRSRINWRVMARTDFHKVYSPIFVYSANLEMLRMYSARNGKYRECTNTSILTLLVRLFSPNVLGYYPRINICAVPPLISQTFMTNTHPTLWQNKAYCYLRSRHTCKRTAYNKRSTQILATNKDQEGRIRSSQSHCMRPSQASQSAVWA